MAIVQAARSSARSSETSSRRSSTYRYSAVDTSSTISGSLMATALHRIIEGMNASSIAARMATAGWKSVARQPVEDDHGQRAEEAFQALRSSRIIPNRYISPPPK